MGELATADGKTARCTVHGGQYQILHSRWRPAPRPSPPAGGTTTLGGTEAGAADPNFTACPHCGRRYRIKAEYIGRTVACKACQQNFEIAPVAAAPAVPMCEVHGSLAATCFCAGCNIPMCATCAFEQPDGTALCKSCVVRSDPASARGGPVERLADGGIADPRVKPGTMCMRHPGVQAVHLCRVCSRPVCLTCDFQFPGNVHVCPDCAASSKRPLSPKRRNMAVGSIVLAVWSTFCIAGLMAGLAGEIEDETAAAAVDLMFGLFVTIPVIIGTALGFGAMDRRLGNPVLVWVGAIWNLVMLCVILLLSLIGSMMG
jgi:predicted Zn finger-like uncharacterized protein